MKKVLLTLLCLSVLLVSVACSSSGNSNTTSSESSKTLTKEEFDQIYTDADKFKGDTVDFYAKIFVPVEKDDTGTYIQAYADPENSEKNTLIAIEDPNLDVKQDDIIHVVGKVRGASEGENAFGAQLVLPIIDATTVEKSDYVTAFAPASKTIELNKEQKQHGFVLTVSKVELAEKETRVYVSIKNESNVNISFFTFDAKLVQDGKQFEIQDNYEASYPEPHSEILPGASTEGIIAFPAVNKDSKKLTLNLEGSSENYDITINPFKFDITWE